MKTKKIILSIIVILIVLGAGFYVDSRMKNMNLTLSFNPAQPNASPSGSTNPSAKIDFQNYGKAPNFVGIDHWLNSNPLTISDLRGKVVLVDFWTYSCINCVRTLPYVTRWYDIYKDKGLIVIGVHTPEFAFEKNTNNVQDAINRFGIHYPVAQDNEYATWTAYNNQYWPAEYLIDQNGNIVHEHFGEGEYDVAENAIRSLLGMNPTTINVTNNNLSGIGSPEVYFGTARLQNLTLEQTPSLLPKVYSFPQNIALNEFALQGNWQFSPDNIKLLGGQGKIRLKFHSGKIYIVASSQNPAKLTITVDGKSQPVVTVKNSQLYTLFDSNDYADHLIEITINMPGFEAFTFTFG